MAARAMTADMHTLRARALARMSLLLVFGFSFSLGTPVVASEPQLRPFKAVYKTSALGMTLDLTRSLSIEDGLYRLTSTGRNFLIKMNESADFKITDGSIEGLRFDSNVKTLKTNKRSVTFNSDEGVIDSLKRGKWTQHKLEPGVLDQFSQQQQLRLTLINAERPPQTLKFRVVDGAKVTDKTWKRLPDETLETPIGAIETVRYQALHKNPNKRASEIWLAPSLDYLMVKTKHVEKASTVRVEIKSLSWLDGA